LGQGGRKIVAGTEKYRVNCKVAGGIPAISAPQYAKQHDKTNENGSSIMPKCWIECDGRIHMPIPFLAGQYTSNDPTHMMYRISVIGIRTGNYSFLTARALSMA
jgi:hypothetical protein